MLQYTFWKQMSNIIIIIINIIFKGRPMLVHSHFHGSSPLFTILHLSPCCVQADTDSTQIFFDGSRPCLSESAGGRFQWLGNPDIAVRSALKWFIHASALATCRKSRKRLSHRTVQSWVWLVRVSTSPLVMRWSREMRRSLLKDTTADMHQSSSQVQRWVAMSRLHIGGLERRAHSGGTSSSPIGYSITKYHSLGLESSLA